MSLLFCSLIPLLFLVSWLPAAEQETSSQSFPVAVIQTSKGDIHVRLRPDIAPKACENFITHAQNKYYDNGIFHRVIRAFMIQGGDPSGTGSGGDSIWKQSFADETTPDVTFRKPGFLAMANAGPNSNRSQFFITTAATPWLNGRHTIFGEVIKGLDVVHDIEAAPVDEMHKPIEEQEIITIRIV